MRLFDMVVSITAIDFIADATGWVLKKEEPLNMIL
jgi:hypothetical protein